jgi:hypothetical protein
MSFFGPEPFESAKVTYVNLGIGVPGAFFVEVEGQVPNFTSNIELLRDSHFVGGLKVDVMGWTGPVGKGTSPYTKSRSFPGQFLPKIVIHGSNKTLVVDVKQIPEAEAEAYFKDIAYS